MTKLKVVVMTFLKKNLSTYLWSSVWRSTKTFLISGSAMLTQMGQVFFFYSFDEMGVNLNMRVRLSISIYFRIECDASWSLRFWRKGKWKEFGTPHEWCENVDQLWKRFRCSPNAYAPSIIINNNVMSIALHCVFCVFCVMEMENVYLARTYISTNEARGRVRLSRRQTNADRSWVQKYLPPQTTIPLPFFVDDERIATIQRYWSTESCLCGVCVHTEISALSTPTMLSRESNCPCSNWASAETERCANCVSDVQTIDDT